MFPLLEREKPMRRANRLFDIVEYLRRAKRVVTAQELAREMEVSVRTVYRDIAVLQALSHVLSLPKPYLSIT